MKTPEDLLNKIVEKQEAQIAALSPEERADLKRRQAERMKRYLEEKKRRNPQLFDPEAALDGAFVTEELAKKSPAELDSFIMEILSETPPEEVEAFLDNCREELYSYLDAKGDDLGGIARDRALAEGRRQGVESAANLQGILGKIEDMKAQGDRIEAQTAPSLTRAQMRDISRHFNTVGASGTRGYVLDFSDKTFDIFTTDTIGRTIRKPGLSKWKSLDAFLADEATPDEASTLLAALLDHEETTKGATEETARLRDILDAAKTSKADAIESNLAARLDRIEAQGDRIEAQGVETRQGVSVLVQHLPDAKKPTVISWDEAVAIMKAKGGDPTWSDRTGRNWLNAGRAAKTGTPISWNDLATVASWSAWVDAYLAALNSKLSKKSFISERKAQAEAAENRRRGRIA